MPINPQTKAAKLRYILADSTPRCLVAQSELSATWTEAVAGLAEPSSILVAGGSPAAAEGRVEPLSTAMETAEPNLADSGLIDLDLASII